jgi:DNA primase/energy-coupling factor transporter ATP-binding protein EcfA2
MEIADIKQNLEITEVAKELGIEINPKTKKALCPFHADKTPSLQFSKEKQIVTCFSSNCNAGTMDVIGLTEKKLNLTTHQALKYLNELIGVPGQEPRPKTEIEIFKDSAVLKKVFGHFETTFLGSKPAKEYATSRHLNIKTQTIGYNAGTFHHKENKYLVESAVKLGLLLQSNNSGGHPVFGLGSLVFALRDEKNQITGMYFRAVEPRPSKFKNKNYEKHLYLKNRVGLYPKYPGQETKKLILTESIIDAATLLNVAEIKTQYEVLALYGTNGLTSEIKQALIKLEELEEIIMFFDGDTAGSLAVEKNGKTLVELLPKVKLSYVWNLSYDDDINNLLDGHDSKIFTHLLKERKLFKALDIQQKKESPKQMDLEQMIKEVETEALSSGNQLLTTNPNKIIYQTETAAYYIKGGIRKDLDSLKVTLVIEHLEYKTKSRNKLDLYEDKQTERVAREASERLNLRADLVEQDLNILTDLLDQYREENTNQTDEESKKVIIPKEEKEKCFKFLKKPKLLENINELIGKSGVVGEEKNRLFLFGIASTYKMENTLHALIQGTSGSGKTHLLATIMDFMPPEDTINLTRVTESSFYNYGEHELSNKLIGMEDFDGLEEKAELAFRELMSKGMISSSTSGKNEHTGQIAAYVKTVFGPIASLSATTKGEIYEDNMSRCFLISVDESQEQTQRIIKYQNNKAAGQIDTQKEKEIKEFLRNCMRLLKPLEVVNPYANKIDLPKEAHKIRRLNDLFQSYVKQVTLLNQYQRKKDVQGRLITDKDDVKTAIEIMFDSILLKVDELDGSLRDFYEKLKKYILSKSKEYEFTRREIRTQTQTSNTQLHRYMKQLIDLEYIYLSSGYDNRGHKHKIAYWDNMEALREQIKINLNNQLNKL